MGWYASRRSPTSTQAGEDGIDGVSPDETPMIDLLPGI